MRRIVWIWIRSLTDSFSFFSCRVMVFFNSEIGSGKAKTSHTSLNDALVLRRFGLDNINVSDNICTGLETITVQLHPACRHPTQGVHNIRLGPNVAVEAFICPKYHPFSMLAWKKHPLNGYKLIDFGPWISKKIWAHLRFEFRNPALHSYGLTFDGKDVYFRLWNFHKTTCLPKTKMVVIRDITVDQATCNGAACGTRAASLTCLL